MDKIPTSCFALSGLGGGGLSIMFKHIQDVFGFIGTVAGAILAVLSLYILIYRMIHKPHIVFRKEKGRDNTAGCRRRK